MYGTFEDPYCYPGTSILKNLPGLRNRVALQQFEAIATAQRADEPLPNGRLGVAHYRAIHRLPEFILHATHFLAELNAIHPFREGNGRTQTTFTVLLAIRAGRIVRVELLRPRRFLAAMIASFEGNEQPLRSELGVFIS